MNKYFVVEFNESFSEIKNISLHKNNKDFIETLDFLKSKIDPNRYWELVSSDSDKFIYIEHLYEFKHSITLRHIVEELEDIHRTISDNLDWMYEEVKQKAVK